MDFSIAAKRTQKLFIEKHFQSSFWSRWVCFVIVLCVCLCVISTRIQAIKIELLLTFAEWIIVAKSIPFRCSSSRALNGRQAKEHCGGWSWKTKEHCVSVMQTIKFITHYHPICEIDFHVTKHRIARGRTKITFTPHFIIISSSCQIIFFPLIRHSL
jgi:hypothetical protein